MKIIPSIPHVLQLEFRNRTELTLSFCRLQEFFESPHEHIRGKVFTLEAFLATYYAPGHEIDYLAHWGGFNVPKAVVDDFFALFHDLTKREQVIEHAWKSGDHQYLIAVDVDDADNALGHELAHARYALDGQYKIAVQKVIYDIPSELLDRLCADLITGEYPDDYWILIDEVHAYLATSFDDEITETFTNSSLGELQPYIDKLKAIK
jgi:hypothetical protein